MKPGDATYIAIILTTDDGREMPVWQKSEIATVKVVTGMVVSYVDAAGNPVLLQEPYEMTVIDGEVLAAPGGV